MTIQKQPAPGIRVKRKAIDDGLLRDDVAKMIQENKTTYENLASDIIIVVRERVLREIESYARESVR